MRILQLRLAGRRAQQVAILAIAGELQLAQPFGEPRGDQDFLVRAQMNPAPLVNQAAEKIKILFCQLGGAPRRFPRLVSVHAIIPVLRASAAFCSSVRVSEARAMLCSASRVSGSSIFQPEAVKHSSRVTSRWLPLKPIFSLRSSRSAICTAAMVCGIAGLFQDDDDSGRC